MTHEALLLTRDNLSEAGCNIGKMLEFFGVAWRAETITEFLAQGCTKDSKVTRLFCSSEIFLELVTQSALKGDRIRDWRERVHSAFVYGGDNSKHLETLARMLTGDNAVTVTVPDGCAGSFLVAEDDELGGAMAGVKVAASGLSNAAVVVLGNSQPGTSIVSMKDGAIFLKADYRGVPVFLSTSEQIINLDSELTAGVFDIRDHVASALPIVLYIKWAFAHACWQPAETNACVIIDDPLLSDRYGFLNFDELLPLMRHRRFCSSIAFIPWNWSRSQPRIVRLFTENPDVYSLSVHGCDHIRAEFGDSDRERLYSKARKALERMAHHKSKTGIEFDRVMVFPQGVFSEAALSALKHTDFIAVSDHGTITVDPHPRKIAVRDVWEGALMSYGGFPIFTRRHPSDGVENLAFDILLGKPALLGIHHDYCSDGYARLIDLVERLNHLKCCLNWRSLGEVVKRCYWRRESFPGVVEVRMYGAELRIENHSGQQQRYLIRKRESEPSAIREICAESRRLTWSFSEGYIRFEFELDPDQAANIGIRLHDLIGNGDGQENLSYRFKTRLRRYLSEVRDNYVMTAKSRLATLRMSLNR